MKTIFLFLLLFLSFKALAPSEQGFILNKRFNAFKQMKIHQEQYENMISFIKKSEGFRATIYNCPAGQATIGYGHMALPGEKFTSITESQADSLLKVDFQKRMDFLPITMEYHKKLAIAHFIWNLGYGKYLKTRLKTLVDSGKPIDQEILKYCHYRNNGKWVKSKWLLKSRIYELNLYNYETTND
jgi:GH24 family phage-related lysozyme (muramidase)